MISQFREAAEALLRSGTCTVDELIQHLHSVYVEIADESLREEEGRELHR